MTVKEADGTRAAPLQQLRGRARRRRPEAHFDRAFDHALAWHNGQAEKARDMWAKAPASAPVFFNRGMAALFCDQAADAKSSLLQAVEQLPEDNAWHHLGRLYLALASIHG